MLATFAALLAMNQEHFRPPAVPLVTHDPYTSIWSFSDKLTDDWTKHWTGKNQAMVGMVRVDGMCYRWMSRGLEDVPAAEQESVKVDPVGTTYTFKAGGVRMTVFFESGADVSSPEDCSRSDTYVQVSFESVDGKAHTCVAYLDCSGELVVNEPSQQVEWGRLNAGSSKEPIEVGMLWHSGGVPLNRVGDDHRIDWGRLYLAPHGGKLGFGSSEEMRRHFADEGEFGPDETRQPRPAYDGWPVMAWRSDSFTVQGDLLGAAQLHLAYDDQFSIEYFNRPLRAAWRSDDADALSLWSDRWSEKPQRAYAKKLTDEWRNLGPDFVNLATLAYRQCLAAHKIVKDIDGTLLMFSKENFSNGCIGTVDVMYPACPIFLAYNPQLAKANMEPIMQYASMPRWKWPFAPHDLGTYPKANGQVYGGGERTEEDQMPVEESGNMLIMAAAYLDKSGDKAWIQKYWPKFTQWAEYLRQYGVDPGNQLCTDDFAGHLAHNANLSVKAIVAMACYGRMCGQLGKSDEAKQWHDLAKGFVKDWMRMADDGDHYRLAFDKPGTWSQKYNLVWDRVLGLGLFPREVYEKEVVWYLKHQNTYGLPLDSRATYTKLDWTVWTACLATNHRDFEAIMAPLYKWMNETPDRVPLTDWFDTKSAKCVGFRARSVVGGVFMPMLLEGR
ncbi:MAG: DUF4965 domain-containing protein [Armatimonadetes bacterium]|nr:DUF4965 domain-containing protein [Armatimonadota bacterium]